MANDNDNAINDRIAIQNMLSFEEIMTQLAEECSELSMAALKYRRAAGKANPTPVTSVEAFNNLLEEVTDVINVLFVAGLIHPDYPVTYYTDSKKIARWKNRLTGLEAC